MGRKIEMICVPPVHGTELSRLLRLKTKEDIQPKGMDMEKVIEAAMDKAAEMEFELFERGVRENASPPIRGEITPGKLKYRKIFRCYNQHTGESWLEQNGTRITDIFKIIWK